MMKYKKMLNITVVSYGRHIVSNHRVFVQLAVHTNNKETLQAVITVFL